MSSKVRRDAELVRRGLARSREQAAELIGDGRVAVAGITAGKSATQVGRDVPITVSEGGGPDYVSRGGHKLAGALASFASATGTAGTGAASSVAASSVAANTVAASTVAASTGAASTGAASTSAGVT